MQQVLTVILQSGADTWCRELSQEQVQAIADALLVAASRVGHSAAIADGCGDAERTLAYEGRESLYLQTREAWLDIAHADREEG